jgi:electron transfer flavoprotein beta subunit
MKIVVPIKRVLDPYAKVKPGSDGTSIDSGGAKSEINPFDEIALEEAVRLREKVGSVEIIVVSIGPAESEEQLRKALAMGADRAVLIETTSSPDARAIALEIESFVRDQNPDLVLMGKQATDDDSNQVGQILAARLGWPQATFASEVTAGAGSLTVVRETDTGTETLQIQLPAVVTADLRLNEPRYIALPGIIKARSKPLEKRAPSTSLQSFVTVTGFTAPPARKAGKRVANVEELIAELKAAGSI